MSDEVSQEFEECCGLPRMADQQGEFEMYVNPNESSNEGELRSMTEHYLLPLCYHVHVCIYVYVLCMYVLSVCM